MTGHQGTPKLRGAAYERVSRSGGRTSAELEATTYREQRELYERAMLARGDVELVHRLRDEDVSGAAASRPALDQLWELVDAGDVDIVVVAYLSRFGRSAVQIQTNVERLKHAGVTFVSAREGLTVDPVKPDPYAGVMLAVLAALAEVERERLREGLASANRNARERGVSIPVPYGYMRENGPGSVLVFDDRADIGGVAPADVVRRIFAMRLEGFGSSAIAQRLNSDGVLTPTRYASLRGIDKREGSSTWSHNTVRGIVQTHTYKGVTPVWQYELVESSRTPGKMIQRPIDDTLELMPAEHDELIDESIWAAAQFDVTPHVRTGEHAGALLRGLVRCQSCSRTMTPSGDRPNGGSAYKCRGGEQCPKPVSVSRPALETFVEQQVLSGAVLDGYELAGELDAKLADVDARIAIANDELVAFREHASPRELGPDFVPTLRRLRVAVSELESKRRELERKRENVERRRFEPGVWETMSVDERREALSDVLDAVVVLPIAKRGQRPAIAERVARIVLRGQSPIPLSRTGRIVEPRPFPLDD